MNLAAAWKADTHLGYALPMLLNWGQRAEQLESASRPARRTTTMMSREQHMKRIAYKLRLRRKDTGEEHDRMIRLKLKPEDVK